jgi:hypothetical protein
VVFGLEKFIFVFSWLQKILPAGRDANERTDALSIVSHALQSFTLRIEWSAIRPCWRLPDEENGCGDIFSDRGAACDFRPGNCAPRSGALEHGRLGHHQRASEGI